MPLFRVAKVVPETEASLQRAPVAPIDVGELARYDRPLPSVTDYDTLLQCMPCVGTA